MSQDLKIDYLMDQNLQWVVLDAALCPEPVWFAKGAELPAHSLFSQPDASLADNGPWLVDMTDNRALIELCLKKDPLGHGTLWLGSDMPTDTLIQLLRARLYAGLPSGDITRFRWYDPRVLYPYLTDSASERRHAFMTPITRLIHADLNPFYSADHWNVWQQDDNSGDVLCQSVPCKEAS